MPSPVSRAITLPLPLLLPLPLFSIAFPLPLPLPLSVILGVESDSVEDEGDDSTDDNRNEADDTLELGDPSGRPIVALSMADPGGLVAIACTDTTGFFVTGVGTAAPVRWPLWTEDAAAVETTPVMMVLVSEVGESSMDILEGIDVLCERKSEKGGSGECGG